MAKDINALVRSAFSHIDELMATGHHMSDIFDVNLRFSKLTYAEYYKNGRHIKKSYRQFREDSVSAAASLSALLLSTSEGSIVGLRYKNCYEWGLIFWGLLMCNRCPLMLDAKGEVSSAARILKEAGAEAIVTEGDGDFGVPIIQASAVLNRSKTAGFRPNWADRLMFCTSGTTGLPKIVVYTGEQMCRHIESARSMPDMTRDIMYPQALGDLKILALLPFHHIFGFAVVFLWYSFFGKTLVFPEDMTSAAIQRTCRRLGVTHVYAVPLVWNGIAQALRRRVALEGPKRVEVFKKLISYNLGEISGAEAGLVVKNIVGRKVRKQLLGDKIRFCITGGGAISTETMRIINGIGYPLYNGFGMTEVCITSVELRNNAKARIRASIGKPFYGVEYRVLAPEGGGPGELAIKYAAMHIGTMSSGYFVPRDNVSGWFLTGDIAEKDSDGYWYIRGRVKDVIVNADGENVYPDEIETRLLGLPGVANYCVFGVYRSSTGREHITLVLEPSSLLLPDELQSLRNSIRDCNASLPMRMRVEEIYLSKDPLPMSSSMKVQRNILREKLLSSPDRYTKLEIQRVFKGSAKNLGDLPDRVRAIVEGTLSLPPESVSDTAHIMYDLGGDSLVYAELILDIEAEFGISVPEELYGKLTCVLDFAQYISEATSAQAELKL
ncbi:MAG: AMP-binding protein [Oscillospiraceae bacterium]